MKREFLLIIGSCLVALAGVELTARAFVYPSDGSAGVLMGRRLPPLRIVPANPSEREPHYGHQARDSPVPRLVVDGKWITVGDLWGYHRPDNLLGYTIEENAVSVNGWWQSNNIGARSRADTQSEIPLGKKRTLVFGESFAASTRVRQEEAWSSILGSVDPGRDVVNLAVDGYSMGQAYMRYLSFKDVLDHSGSLMTFVPTLDLWRDVNTIRDLYYRWNMPEVQPRFIMERGRLQLVRSPYSNPSDIYADNMGGLSVLLRDHLRQYDRFYFKSMYEAPPIIGHLIMYKLAALAAGQFAKKAVMGSLMQPGSEAMEVSRAIFLAMQADEARIGAEFALMILPTEYDLEHFGGDFSRMWQAMVDFICSGIRHCIDLAPALLEMPQHAREKWDHLGGHYGPTVNRRIGKIMHTEFVRRGL